MKFPIKNPFEGEVRTRRRFAWEKVTVIGKDGVLVDIWFEWYTVTEKFIKYQPEVAQEWKILERKAIK